jgi:hypothetical protein
VRFEYEARLVPIDRFSIVLVPRQGEVIERFDRFTFAGEQTHPERVKVTTDHNETEVGHLTRLEPCDGWWTCRFRLDCEEVADYGRPSLKVAQPISIECTPVHQHDLGDGASTYRLARLDAVSIVDRGAYDDARITAIHNLDAPLTSFALPPLPEDLAASLKRSGINVPAMRRAKPQPQPQIKGRDWQLHPPGGVIYRPGIGKILRVY